MTGGVRAGVVAVGLVLSDYNGVSARARFPVFPMRNPLKWSKISAGCIRLAMTAQDRTPPLRANLFRRGL